MFFFLFSVLSPKAKAWHTDKTEQWQGVGDGCGVCVLYLIHSSNDPQGTFSTLFPCPTYIQKTIKPIHFSSAKYQQQPYACIGTTGNKEDFLNLGSASLLQDEPRRVAALLPSILHSTLTPYSARIVLRADTAIGSGMDG